MIVAEVALLDRAVFDGDFAVEGGCQSVDDAGLDLRAEAVGRYCNAGIHCGNNSVHLGLAVDDGHLDHLRDNGSEAFLKRNPASLAFA